jgi:diketogulonate reductase-like aldo/keto reductase
VTSLRTVQGVTVPTFMYGTAWKEDETARLVGLALAAGFRAIDTANQRKHYFEAAVGEALRAALAAGKVRREDLFLQSKFTFAGGQDHRLPYDPTAPYAVQVEESIHSSLDHLGVERLDAFVLHGPSTRRGLGPADLETWAAMEAQQRAGRTRVLGVSNVGLDQLEALQARATVKPAFVQNRCYAVTGWDRDVRAFCREHDIVYQGFSLLTANREVLAHRATHAIAARLKATAPQVIFAFARAVGMLPLTGTSSPQHMDEDLRALDLELTADEVGQLEAIAIQ